MYIFVTSKATNDIKSMETIEITAGILFFLGYAVIRIGISVTEKDKAEFRAFIERITFINWKF